VKNKIALLNIGAYHSADARSFGSLLALPSSRVSVGWAQDVLFPDAEAGRRIVVCMRSASYWGLEQGRKYEGIPVAALRIAAREVGPLIPGTSAFTRVQLRSPGRRAPPHRNRNSETPLSISFGFRCRKTFRTGHEKDSIPCGLHELLIGPAATAYAQQAGAPGRSPTRRLAQRPTRKHAG
jgi:hypothetical protein